MISDKEGAKLLDKWPIGPPEYRRFICADCGRTISKAWHIHCLDGGYKREYHLCRKCGKKWGYETGT